VDIEARVEWALETAYARLNAELASSPYTVPFELPYPTEATNAQALIAGVILHDLRGGKDDDEIKEQRKQALGFSRKIIAGQLRIVGLTGTTNAPGVVKDSGCGCPAKCVVGTYKRIYVVEG
jgi:phage gp36-like protein